MGSPLLHPRPARYDKRPLFVIFVILGGSKFATFESDHVPWMIVATELEGCKHNLTRDTGILWMFLVPPITRDRLAQCTPANRKPIRLSNEDSALLPSMAPQQLIGNSGNVFVPFPEMVVKISKSSVLRRRHEADYLPSDTRHPFHENARVRFSIDRTEGTTRSTIVVSTIFASFGQTMVLFVR